MSNTIHSTRFPEVIRAMLQAYLDQLEQQLAGLVSGVYIHGSIALGAFDEQRSDIDMSVVMTRRATEDDIRKLKAIHEAIASQYPRWLLEVSYVQSADLGQPENAITRHPIYHDKTFGAAGHFDTSPVTWWVLKNKGVAVLGADPHSLPFTVDWPTLIADMKHNMNTYWASFTHQPSRMMRCLSNEGVAWIVLGVLRQYYSFRENDITSKVGAGEYALKHLPEEWHGLVQDALDIRRGKKPTRYLSRFTRAYATVGLLKYVIRVCNAE